MYEPTATHRQQLALAFRYHPPHAGQPQRYELIRSTAGALAEILVTRCPPSRELSVALTKLEEAVFWANAAIARNEAAPLPGSDVTTSCRG